MHPSWKTYFRGLDNGMRSQDAFRPPPNLVSLEEELLGQAPIDFGVDSKAIEDHMKVRPLLFVVESDC